MEYYEICITREGCEREYIFIQLKNGKGDVLNILPEKNIIHSKIEKLHDKKDLSARVAYANPAF